jgi:UPF0755 protein
MMRKISKYLFYIFLTGCLAGTALLWIVVLRPNVKSDAAVRIYLPSGSSFESLLDTLKSSGALRSERNFLVTARIKSFHRSMKSGSYLIEPGMNNYKIVNMLRSGRQAPVNVTFNNIRTLDELAARVGSQIEAGPESCRSSSGMKTIIQQTDLLVRRSYPSSCRIPTSFTGTWIRKVFTAGC